MCCQLPWRSCTVIHRHTEQMSIVALWSHLPSYTASFSSFSVLVGPLLPNSRCCGTVPLHTARQSLLCLSKAFFLGLFFWGLQVASSHWGAKFGLYGEWQSNSKRNSFNLDIAFIDLWYGAMSWRSSTFIFCIWDFFLYIFTQSIL